MREKKKNKHEERMSTATTTTMTTTTTEQATRLQQNMRAFLTQWQTRMPNKYFEKLIVLARQFSIEKQWTQAQFQNKVHELVADMKQDPILQQEAVISRRRKRLLQRYMDHDMVLPEEICLVRRYYELNTVELRRMLLDKYKARLLPHLKRIVQIMRNDLNAPEYQVLSDLVQREEHKRAREECMEREIQEPIAKRARINK